MSNGMTVNANKVSYLRPETQERLRGTRKHPTETDDLLVSRLLDEYERQRNGQEAKPAADSGL